MLYQHSWDEIFIIISMRLILPLCFSFIIPCLILQASVLPLAVKLSVSVTSLSCHNFFLFTFMLGLLSTIRRWISHVRIFLVQLLYRDQTSTSSLLSHCSVSSILLKIYSFHVSSDVVRKHLFSVSPFNISISIRI